MIQFFNTLSGKLEEFKPLHDREVKIYTCGPTVYDFAHIGNFRTFVFEDLLRRFLEFEGFKVQHVMNLTDVDDKTIAGAAREGKPLNDYTAKYIESFAQDLQTLNILPARPQPRATEEIKSMIELVEKLIQKGVAYESDGSVYYRVAAFSNYGKLSKKDLAQNIAGARVDVDEYEKEEGADFVLWKKSKEGEPSWSSPWGPGRPGWHIECSAMSMKYLGETFDIHAGGEDLIFPHHENEIAQSEAATGKPFVKYWLHSKHLLVDGHKMSKSKGNFYTLRDLLEKGYDPMAIRYELLSVHYRQPLNFTLEGLKSANELIKKLDDCYWQCLSYQDIHPNLLAEEVSGFPVFHLDAYFKTDGDLLSSLKNDLNISAALDHFSKGVRTINQSLAGKQIKREFIRQALAFFNDADRLFGLDISQIHSIPSEIAKKLFDLQKFRGAKEFSKADQLRSELKESGWLVKDGRPGEPSIIKKKRRAWDQ